MDSVKILLTSSVVLTAVTIKHILTILILTMLNHPPFHGQVCDVSDNLTLFLIGCRDRSARPYCKSQEEKEEEEEKEAD